MSRAFGRNTCNASWGGAGGDNKTEIGEGLTSIESEEEDGAAAAARAAADAALRATVPPPSRAVATAADDCLPMA